MDTNINLGSVILGFDKNKMTVSLYNQSEVAIVSKSHAKDIIKELKKIIKDSK